MDPIVSVLGHGVHGCWVTRSVGAGSDCVTWSVGAGSFMSLLGHRVHGCCSQGPWVLASSCWCWVTGSVRAGSDWVTGSVGAVSQGPWDLALIGSRGPWVLARSCWCWVMGSMGAGSRGLWALVLFVSVLGHGTHKSLDATDSFLALCGLNSTIFQIRILKHSRDLNVSLNTCDSAQMCCLWLARGGVCSTASPQSFWFQVWPLRQAISFFKRVYLLLWGRQS